jgi:hypothetical protein
MTAKLYIKHYANTTDKYKELFKLYTQHGFFNMEAGFNHLLELWGEV